jgi:hypothetical protein
MTNSKTTEPEWMPIAPERTTTLLTGLLRDCTGVLEERIVVVEGKRVSEMRVVRG